MSEDISNSKIKHRQDVRASRSTKTTGAPNEDIVQNHLNIALLNVF